MRDKIAVVGAGYVGLVTAGCLAEAGHKVFCIDQDREKVNSLKRGCLSIYEPGLAQLIDSGLNKERLLFETDLPSTVRYCDVIFITVGTPSDRDGKTKLDDLIDSARLIGQYMDSYKIVINKSTAPVGTVRFIEQVISSILQERNKDLLFDVVSNPEFLREGTAILDFLNPQRVVLGTDNVRAEHIIRWIYSFIDWEKVPLLVTRPETAEMIKLTANAFLAMKVSFINEISNLCEKLNADVSQVSQGIGLDSRIGPHFFKPGPGFGGSCFPKDTRALAYQARELGSPLSLVEATIAVNSMQSAIIVDRIAKILGDYMGKTVCVLGLTFKRDTDDIRESPSLAIIRELINKGIGVRAYDPRGNKNAQSYFEQMKMKDEVAICNDSYEAARQAHMIIVPTDWVSFKELDLILLRSNMAGSDFFDLRNMFSRRQVEKAGFQYFSMGVG